LANGVPLCALKFVLCALYLDFHLDLWNLLRVVLVRQYVLRSTSTDKTNGSLSKRQLME
jgi:hypothetical protein